MDNLEEKRIIATFAENRGDGWGDGKRGRPPVATTGNLLTVLLPGRFFFAGWAEGAGQSGPMSQRLLADVGRLARNSSLLVARSLRSLAPNGRQTGSHTEAAAFGPLAIPPLLRVPHSLHASAWKPAFIIIFKKVYPFLRNRRFLLNFKFLPKHIFCSGWSTPCREAPYLRRRSYY